MEARELRIGNWVCLPSGVNCQIDREDFKYQDGLANIENYNPIPLTEEWLLRFEWNYLKRGVYQYLNSDFQIDESGHLYYGSSYCGINIQYVHQLQNLYFALTGTELELK